MNKFLASLSHNPKTINTLSELIDYHKRTPEEKVDEYGITEFEAANQSVYTEDSEEFIASLEKRNQFGKEIEMLLDSAESDVIVMPGSGDTPSDMGGNPAVLVPLGFYTKNRPISRIKDNIPYKGPKIP